MAARISTGSRHQTSFSVVGATVRLMPELDGEQVEEQAGDADDGGQHDARRRRSAQRLAQVQPEPVAQVHPAAPEQVQPERAPGEAAQDRQQLLDQVQERRLRLRHQDRHGLRGQRRRRQQRVDRLTSENSPLMPERDQEHDEQFDPDRASRVGPRGRLARFVGGRRPVTGGTDALVMNVQLRRRAADGIGRSATLPDARRGRSAPDAIGDRRTGPRCLHRDRTADARTVSSGNYAWLGSVASR